MQGSQNSQDTVVGLDSVCDKKTSPSRTDGLSEVGERFPTGNVVRHKIVDKNEIRKKVSGNEGWASDGDDSSLQRHLVNTGSQVCNLIF